MLGVPRPQGVPGVPNSLGQQPQAGLRSGSPALNANNIQLSNVLNTGNRVLFPPQTPNAQQNTQQQQPNVVGLSGPSPTASNPGLSPFGGNPLSQGSTTASTPNQFPTTSNGPVSLPQVSPAGNATNQQQQNQFNDMLNKNRMAPSPSNFVTQQTLQQQQQQHTQSNNTTNGPPRIPSVSGADSVSASHQAIAGPKSVSSSRGASPAPATPIQSSPATAASLGNVVVLFR